MKTGKQLFGLLLAAALFAGIQPLKAQDASADADFYTVSGVVKDQKNKKTLEYVNISLPGTSIGTITNADGEFSIKIKHATRAQAVEISHVGYLSTTIPANGRDESGLTILLVPNVNAIEEIIVRAQDPRYLVEMAIERIADNYSQQTHLLTGFYRETAQKGRRYINISEAIIDVYKTPYLQNVDRDRVQIFKGRSLLSQKKSDTLVVKLLGGPNLSVYVDIVKNPDVLLDREMLTYYSYKMEESVMIDERPQYVVSFEPQVILPYALYRGKLYIDRERLAFTRAEFELDMNDRNKATQAILKKKPFGLRFKPVGVSYLVSYTQRDGLSHLSYIRNEVRFNCDWKRRLFATSYTILSEMVVTDSQGDNISVIPNRLAFKASQSLSDKVADFMDDDFWGAYNIIEPTESLDSAVDRLKKQRR